MGLELLSWSCGVGVTELELRGWGTGVGVLSWSSGVGVPGLEFQNCIEYQGWNCRVAVCLDEREHHI